MIQKRIDALLGGLQRHKGYSYCVVMQSEIERQALLNGLSQLSKVSIVSQDGSLISHLTAAENIALPLHFHAMKSDCQVSDALCSRCGLLDEREMQVLLMKFPEQMSLYEKRLVGFVRAICVEPDMMVYDGIYDGLAQHEVDLVRHFDACFHLHFPFRTSVLLSFENAYHPDSLFTKNIYLDALMK